MITSYGSLFFSYFFSVDAETEDVVTILAMIHVDAKKEALKRLFFERGEMLCQKIEDADADSVEIAAG